MTSGRHKAIASAMAWEPSICFSIRFSSRLRHGPGGSGIVRLGGGGNIGLADLSGEFFCGSPVATDFEVDKSGERREGAEQRRVRHRPPDMFKREFGRRHGDGMATRQFGDDRVEVEIGKAPVGIDQEIAVFASGPANTSIALNSVTSWTINASGAAIGSRRRISLSSIRQKETTGAPMRSEPKLGKACACFPSRNAATERTAAAVTTPWPPRP